MRIESLTLHNLNALRGRWHIDFNALAGSGIFAITGPTGAGKSTILDALCLALYGQTPRLGKITANSNELMSRHTGECSAEAVIAAGGRRYRVFWGQKRARGRAGGKLQAARHEIADADSGAILEDKLSRTPQAVEALTGLDFDRFVRAVLLAQGQFAAFLHAGADERAPILEQITGTEIYSRLSIAAHARHQEEQRILHALQGDSDRLAPPDAETLAQLAKEMESAAQAVAQAKAARDRSAALYRRQDDYARQQALCAQLAAELAQARNDHAALQTVRDALALHRRAQAGVPVYQHWQREQRAAQDFGGQYAQALAQEKTLQDALHNAEQQAEHAARRHQAAQHAEQAAQPALHEARRLDSDHRHLHSRAAEWRERAASLAFADAAALHALAARDMDKDALDRAYRARLDGQSPEYWQAAREQARERYGILRELLHRQEERHDILRKISILQEQYRAGQEELAAHRQAEQNAQDALHAAENTLADKRRIYEQALRLRQFETHRAHLRDGEPCPLCGAREHPYAQGIALPDDDHGALRAAENAHGQVQAALRQAQHARVRCESAGESLRQTLEQTRQHADAMQEALAQDLHRLQVGAETLPQALADCETAGKAIAERLRDLHDLQARREQAAQSAQARQWQQATQTLAAIEKDIQANRSARQAMPIPPDTESHAAHLRQAVEKAAREQSLAQEALGGIRTRLGALHAQMHTLQNLQAGHAQAAAAAEQAFGAFLHETGFADLGAWQAAQHDAAQIGAWQTHAQEAENARNALEARLARETAQRDTLRAALPDDLPDAQTLGGQLEQDEALYAQALQTQGQLLALEREYAARAAQVAARQAEIAAQHAVCEVWRQLYDLIGSADGKKFRNFAQGLTFDVMIAHANRELAKMSDRYVLVRAQDGHLGLDVMDDWQGGEVRTTKNLSGGEQFIVSLALALGLSAMAGEKIRIDSLFLDEGFGTLDEQALDQALDTLASLPAQGKLIGIISHVGALRERIGTQIQVVPQSSGVSSLQGEGVEKW